MNKYNYYRDPYTVYRKKVRNTKIINGLLIALIILLNGVLMMLVYILGTMKTSSEFQTWNFQKEYPVIRIYAGGSQYRPLIYEAVGKYNTIVPIFAIIDTPENADVVCYDFEEAMQKTTGTMGITEETGKIGFNRYLLKNKSDTIILSVILHELGHAIGMKHNEEPYSVMNSKYNPVVFNDKDIERIKTIWNQSFQQ